MGEPGPRRRAREAALQVLFAADIGHHVDPSALPHTFAEVAGAFELPERVRERARELCLGVAQNLKRLDEEIERAGARWRLARMATVDRNILRLATYELLFERDTPSAVVIDEAVEIARRFAGESSPAFVNGVLDEIATRARSASP